MGTFLDSGTFRILDVLVGIDAVVGLDVRIVWENEPKTRENMASARAGENAASTAHPPSSGARWTMISEDGPAMTPAAKSLL